MSDTSNLPAPPVSISDITPLHMRIVEDVFKCKQANLTPAMIFFSCEEDTFKEAVNTLESFLQTPEVIKNCYISAGEKYGFTPTDDFFGLPEDLQAQFIKEALNTVTSSRKVPVDDIPQSLYILSNAEVISLERNNFLQSFFKKNSFADTLLEYSSAEYRPSAEILEIAVLTALLVKSMETKSKGLWTPGQMK